jgi:putative redox protein
MINANVKWAGKRQLVATGEKSGHSIVVDMAKDKSGDDTGMRPTELLLLSVATCTAIDMLNILGKMKIQLSRCEVKIEGSQQDDLPKYFNKMKLKYILSGEGLNQKKAEKAVSLSMDKYCAVSQTLKGRTEFETEIEIV